MHCGGKWGIAMFMGEYHHSIDDKGRVIIPSKLRDKLGTKFVVTQGLEKCLFVYPMDEWNKITSNLNQLPFTKKDARVFSRIFISGATECEFDRQGRINITSPLVSYADLNKELVIIGVNDRIEIWSKERWDAFLDENADKFEGIAENLFDQNAA